MVSFGDAIKQQGRTVLCNLLGGPSSVPYLGGTPNPDINSLQRRINGARKYFCNESDEITEEQIRDDYGGEPPPFTGGQCPGVSYNVTTRVQIQTADGGTLLTNFVNRTVVGPVSRKINVIDSPPFFPQGNANFYVVVDGNGQEFANHQVNIPDNPIGSAAQSASWETFNVVRADAQPDICGDPPGVDPVIPPYVPTPIVINIEYEDGDNITINEDITFNVFAPIVLIGGAIIAPITVSGNNFSLVGEVALNGDFEIKFFPDFNLNIGGSVDDPIPPPGRPIELPEVAPSSRAIVGAIVTVTDAQGGRATQIGQGTNPDIFAPRLGNISFYVSTSRGTAWTTDVPIKNVRQYVQCPYPFGAVDVAATPETGYAFDVQPVFDRPLLEPA